MTKHTTNAMNKDLTMFLILWDPNTMDNISNEIDAQSSGFVRF
jgi:hypothetical protein